MSQANPQATSPGGNAPDYRGLAETDRQYLDTLTWVTGACCWRSSQCTSLVTDAYIEQGTLPGGRVQQCRWHSGYKLFLRRLEAGERGEHDYRPNIHA